MAEQADALALAVEAAGQIDLAIALGTVSRGWRGAPVVVSDEVRLVGARHPLLDPKTAVPIDLDLGDLRALVISGPNTGGKTVALKTLGLAALLHQSGLRPPAETAALPVFDQVLADIGDRQSIEMSLSTFSGHVANLVEILRAARDRSLVLLDEVAGGTDPVEGSALAQALLAQLADQARLTVVTTHYSELKEWASTTDGRLERGDGARPRHARAAVSARAGTAGHLARAPDRRAARPRRDGRRGRTRAGRPRAAPDRGAARGGRGGRAQRGRRAQLAAGGARGGGTARRRARAARESELEAEIAAVKASAAAERERAAAEALARARDRTRGARGAARRDQDGAPQAARRAGARPQARRGVGASRASGARDQRRSTSRCR